MRTLNSLSDEIATKEELIARYKLESGLTPQQEAAQQQPYYSSQNTYPPRYYQRIAINRTAVSFSPEATEEKTENEWVETAPICVDFDALYEINEDVVAWLYCPDTPINYPIVQAEDNDYYLRRRLDGTYDAYGTLFLDCRNSLTDRNCIVYGHNMYSEAMFGTLTEYKNQDYFDAHPTMYFITPQQSYRVDILAGFTTSSASEIYNSLNPQETQALLLSRMELSDFESGVSPTKDARLLTLSTCAYESDDARYVLVGALQPIGN